MHLRKSITRETTSSGDSSTMNFCPLVSVTTVSGVTSTCSMRSEFNTSGTWLMRVSRITQSALDEAVLFARQPCRWMSFLPHSLNRHSPILLEAGEYSV